MSLNCHEWFNSYGICTVLTPVRRPPSTSPCTTHCSLPPDRHQAHREVGGAGGRPGGGVAHQPHGDGAAGGAAAVRGVQGASGNAIASTPDHGHVPYAVHGTSACPRCRTSVTVRAPCNVACSHLCSGRALCQDSTPLRTVLVPPLRDVVLSSVDNGTALCFTGEHVLLRRTLVVPYHMCAGVAPKGPRGLLRRLRQQDVSELLAAQSANVGQRLLLMCMPFTQSMHSLQRYALVILLR